MTTEPQPTITTEDYRALLQTVDRHEFSNTVLESRIHQLATQVAVDREKTHDQISTLKRQLQLMANRLDRLLPK